MLKTEFFEKLSVSAQTHSRSEKAQLSSGWILIRSELSSLNFNSSVRAEQSFAIHYFNVVIKSLCGNLATRLTPTFGREILFACFRSQTAIESERCFRIAFFGRALEQFSRFRDRNPFWSQKRPSTRMHLLPSCLSE